LNTRYFLEVRTQPAKIGKSGWSGPDAYVAVQEAPEGVERLVCLNNKHAVRRGITIHYMGEGYSRHTGPRSAFGKALLRAREWIALHDKTVVDM